jgi:hypothetical protein
MLTGICHMVRPARTEIEVADYIDDTVGSQSVHLNLRRDIPPRNRHRDTAVGRKRARHIYSKSTERIAQAIVAVLLRTLIRRRKCRRAWKVTRRDHVPAIWDR